jgi:hypothetical protein
MNTRAFTFTHEAESGKLIRNQYPNIVFEGYDLSALYTEDFDSHTDYTGCILFELIRQYIATCL